MADLEDLNNKPISEMTTDEAIELMRQIRLSRRTPTKAKQTKQKQAQSKKQAPKVNADQAAELLKILGGK